MPAVVSEVEVQVQVRVEAYGFGAWGCGSGVVLSWRGRQKLQQVCETVLSWPD